MTEADINAPVSWLCVDCGFNTAPGCSTRAELCQAMIVEGKKEVEQVINAQSELYTVRDAVWARARMHPDGGCLCIGCLERRLGRKLKTKDFLRDDPLNHPHVPATKRLLDRRRKGEK